MSLNSAPYTGWGRVLSADAGRTRPEKATALRRQLAETPGPALGGLRSYGDAALSGLRAAVDMTRLDRMLAFDPQTGVLEAEAGVRLTDILEHMAPRGWMPAVMPGTGHATLGGAIAADVHGKNHHQMGSFGQHVESIRLLDGDGQATDLDGTSHSELFSATMGGMGLAGVIESARIRLAPCPSGTVEVQERRIPDLDGYLEAFAASTSPFQVGWIDATATGAALGRGVLEEASFSPPGAPYVPPSKGSTIPVDAPGFLLAGPIVRAFNARYFRRIPAAGRSRTRPLGAFLFPLDSIAGWNRLYGKSGFHQFQCALPPETAPATLRTMLAEIGTSGLAAPLAVLKRMGPGRAGPLSFPMEGYTLAVDFPNKPAAETLITRLIDQTAEAGGRIYMAKDSVAQAGHIQTMYPELSSFRDIVRKADPDGVFETDLARRLALRGTP